MSNEVTEVPVSIAEQTKALIDNYGMDDLRAIADRIGAPTARKKSDLAARIVARADDQGLGYLGYTAAVALGPVVATEPATSDSTPGEDPGPPVAAGEAAVSKPQSSSDNGNQALFDPYETRIKHFMFTIGEVIDPVAGLLDGPTADAEIERYLLNGYDPVEVFVAGYDTRGQRVGWVLEKVATPMYTEVRHVMRTLVANANPNLGLITGFQADAYIGDFLNQGWELLGVRFNGIDSGPAGGAGGVYLIWFLAR